MDDDFLVRQTLDGNRDAFRLLVLRYQRPLFRFLGLLDSRRMSPRIWRSRRSCGCFARCRASTPGKPGSGPGCSPSPSACRRTSGNARTTAMNSNSRPAMPPEKIERLFEHWKGLRGAVRLDAKSLAVLAGDLNVSRLGDEDALLLADDT